MESKRKYGDWGAEDSSDKTQDDHFTKGRRKVRKKQSCDFNRGNKADRKGQCGQLTKTGDWFYEVMVVLGSG